MFKAAHAASIEFWIISRIICADSSTEKVYLTTTGIGKCICGARSVTMNAVYQVQRDADVSPCKKITNRS